MRATQRKGLDGTCQAIACSPLAGRPVIGRRVLPKSADFVDDRDAEASPDPQRRQRIEDRRVSMQDVGTYRARHFFETPRRCAHLRHFPDAGQAVKRAWFPRRSVEMKTVDVFFQCAGHGMLRTRHMERLPAQAPLLAQDRTRAERVAALERDRMVENMQDAKAHWRLSRPSICACGNRCVALMPRSFPWRPPRRETRSGERPRTSATSRSR